MTTLLKAAQSFALVGGVSNRRTNRAFRIHNRFGHRTIIGASAHAQARWHHVNALLRELNRENAAFDSAML